MLTEDWLCRKLAKLDLTLVEGYPSCGSEPGGLAKVVFLRPAKLQSKWYGLHTDVKTDTKTDSAQLTHWSTDSSKLNSSYSRIAKYIGLSQSSEDRNQTGHVDSLNICTSSHCYSFS